MDEGQVADPEIGGCVQYSLQADVDPGRFGSSLVKATSRWDGRTYSILRLPRTSLALHPDWQQQVQNAVQLRHPHIMQVHEMFLDEQYLNVVLDDCTGGSLRQYVLQQGGRLSEDRARWLFQQLVLAVDYLHSMHVAGLNLQDVMLQASISKPDQRMAHICCPLIKLTSTSSSWRFCESEQLADIAACGVVLLNMLGGRLKEYSWGYNISTSPDMPSTSSGASAAAGVRTPIGASAVASASAEAPYLLPADYTEVLTIGCQQLLQRLLSPNPLGVVLSAAELLQDSWVQHNLTPAAASLNQKCRGMRPLWKEAEQQLPGILAAAASTKLGCKVWQHLTGMQEELEGGWQQQLDASLFGCSNASVAVYAAQDSQQQRSLWACSLLLQGPACAGTYARSESQLAEHAGGMERPGAPAGLLRQPEPPQLLRDQDQQQDQQHQELPQEHVHDQQSTQQHWPTDTRELEARCRMFTRVPSPGFMSALQQLYAGQTHAAGSSGSSSGERTAGPVAPVVGMCLQPPVLLLEELRHGTLASWLAKQQQETEQELHMSLPPAWPVLQQLLLDVAAGLQALHSQDPPLVHGCVNAGAVHLLQPLSTQPAVYGSLAQLSLLWPWRQAVSRTRSAHPWLSAPEVLQQAATPTPASDVYGLGVLMLQLLTGWVPGVSKAAGAGAAAQQSSGWSLDSPVPGAALAAAVEKAETSGNQQGLQQLCAELEAVCGLSWRIFPKGDSSSSSMAAAATAAAVGLPARVLGLMWACLSDRPAARPSLARVIAQLEGMEGPAGQATTSASGTLATDLSLPSRTDAQQPSTSAGMGPGSAAGSQAACSGTGPAAQHLADCSEPAEATEAAADSMTAPHNYGGAAAVVKLLGSTVEAATQHNAAQALAHMTANSAADRAAVVAAGGAAAGAPTSRAAACDGGGVAALVAVLNSTADAAVRLQAAKALAGLAAGALASQAAVCDGGGVAALVAVLNSTADAAVQLQAASALAVLAAGNLTSQAPVCDGGGVAALVAVLDRSADAAVQLQAASALAVLAAGDLTSQAPVCDGGGVAALVAVLDRSADAAVQLQVAKALAGLAAGALASQAAVCDGGGVAALVAVLNSTADAAVQLQAAKALAGLAAGDYTSQAAVCDGGGVAALVAVLHRSGDAAVQLQAVEALAYLARGGPTSQAAVRHAGCIPALVAVLNRSADAAVRLQAFMALSLLVKPLGCWLNQASVLAAGGMLDAVRTSGDAHVQMRQASIIADLAAHNSGCRHAISKAGGVTVFKRLLHTTTNAGVQVHASVALDALKRRPPRFNNKNKNTTRTPRHPPRFTCF